MGSRNLREVEALHGRQLQITARDLAGYRGELRCAVYIVHYCKDSLNVV